MTEDDRSKQDRATETRYVALGLIALAVFAAVFMAVAIGLGEWVDRPR